MRSFEIVNYSKHDSHSCNFTLSQLSFCRANHCHYGAYCNHKGRMYANFWLRAHPDGASNDYLLRLHEANAETVIKRLQLFILRANVSIEAQTLQHIGLNATAAKALCQASGVVLPEAFHSVDLGNDAILCTLPGDYFELFLPAENTLAAPLDDMRKDIEGIESLRLSAGHFHIYPSTSEQILPQQTPLETWGGINYQKGCYVGQEIIARNKYRGKVNKGLAYAVFDTPVETALLAPVLNGDKPVGKVIDTYTGAQTYCLALLPFTAFGHMLNLGDANQQARFTPIIPLSD
ncbi:MAG: hypothetical protein CR977_01345 [Gammaproteobacteria bacterium]|nr:MAG: hypothetical protein CR977_01345 [Gammaproteobacteria bacterium]